MGRRERSRGEKGVKVERGKGSQEEGWKNNRIPSQAPFSRLVRSDVRGPEPNRPTSQPDLGPGGEGQNVMATFLVRLLAGAVTGQLRGKRPQMVNDVPPGSAPTSNHQGTRVRTECKGLRKKEKNTGRRSTDERRRTTTDDGDHKAKLHNSTWNFSQMYF